MATNRQVCASLTRVFRLSDSAAKRYSERLMTAGLVNGAKGVPMQLSAQEVIAVLVAVLVGSSTIDAHMRMRPVGGGLTFRETLADLLSHPYDLIECRIDVSAPGAVLTRRSADNGLQTLTFAAETPVTRTAIAREAILSPDQFIRLGHELESAPEVRAGRPAASDRHIAIERAIRY